MIQPFPFLMTVWQLQSFFPPQAFDLLVIDHPAFDPKELGNLAIAIPAILFGQSDHRQTQFLVIFFTGDGVTEGAAGKANRFAGPALRCVQLLTNIDCGLTQISSRQAFGFR
ncbi:MAG: hypothetical protein RIM72_05940 [Alphaproteobacteria bacterium]